MKKERWMKKEGRQNVNIMESSYSSLSQLGVIGNSTFGALINQKGRCVWACPGHFGGDPIFNSLLNNHSDQTGFYDVVLTDFMKSDQQYIRNSGVLCTKLFSNSNEVIEIHDFTPRFMIFDRIHDPFQMFRMLIPIVGDPQISIRIRPTFNYNASEGFCTRGSNHIRYCGPHETWRVTTNAPILNIMEEIPFLLQKPVYIILGTDESIQSSIEDVFLDFERKTTNYWLNYVNLLNIPVEYEMILIRSAITLKMLTSEEQGGLVSSLTMGIPLGPDAPPTRDERVFRAMDECLSLTTLREIGMLDVCRKLLEFFKNMTFRNTFLMSGTRSEATLPCERAHFLAGYAGKGPVYSGGIFIENQKERLSSKSQVENCLLVIALTQVFYDERLRFLASTKLFGMLEKLTQTAFQTLEYLLTYYGESLATSTDTPHTSSPLPTSLPFHELTAKRGCPLSLAYGYFDDDPRFLNIWKEEEGANLLFMEKMRESRDFYEETKMDSKHYTTMQSTPLPSTSSSSSSPPSSMLSSGHTFTSALCWAACDKLSKLSEHLAHYEKGRFWQKNAKLLKEKIFALSWNSKRNTFTTYWRGQTTGPSLLRLAEIGFVEGTSLHFVRTVTSFEMDASFTASTTFPMKEMENGGEKTGGNQEPKFFSSSVYTANTLLWYVEALRACGRVSEARMLFEAILKSVNNCGLLSQSIDLKSKQLWGNFPYSPSLLGLLRCGHRLSKQWKDI